MKIYQVVQKISIDPLYLKPATSLGSFWPVVNYSKLKLVLISQMHVCLDAYLIKDVPENKLRNSMAGIKSYMSWRNGKMFCTRDQWAFGFTRHFHILIE
jgi:hypothetical protein